MRSRVMPGSSPTMERRSPTSRLKSVDFPTFGRPTIATSGSAAPLASLLCSLDISVLKFNVRPYAPQGTPLFKDKTLRRRRVGGKLRRADALAANTTKVIGEGARTLRPAGARGRAAPRPRAARRARGRRLPVRAGLRAGGVELQGGRRPQPPRRGRAGR